MRVRSLYGSLVAFLAVCLTLSTAMAADFPAKPIKLIVGYKAGGGVDTYARALAKVAPKYLGDQPLVVVNKPGAGGLIGGRFVADQPPTGYVLYLSSVGSMLLKNLARPQVVGSRDFRMVGTIGELSGGVFVPAASPIKSLPELIAKLKSSDRKLRWGHTGRGGFLHIAGVGLLSRTGVKAQDIPFKGGAGARSAVIGGQVDFAVFGAHMGRGFEKEMRLLAVLTDHRLPVVKDVPSVKELGIDYVKVTSPIVVMAPKRIKGELVKKLSDSVMGMVGDPAYKGFLAEAGLGIAGEDADATHTMIQDALVAWKPLVGK